MSGSWTALKHPGLRHQFAAPIVVNNNEIILVSQSKINCLQSANEYKPGIYKYHIIEQKTSLFISYSDLDVDINADKVEYYNHDKFKMKYHTVSIDLDKNHLYILDGSGHFLIIDLERKCKLHCQKMEYIGVYPQSCFINGKFHIIGGSNSRKHLIWNNETNKFEVEYIFNDLQDSLYGFALIYIENKKSLYLLSGIDGMNDLKSIYIYSLKHKKWILSQTKLHCIICTQSVVATPNEKYILMFNGNKESNHQRYVHILDLDTMQIIKTNTMLPSDAPFYSIINTNHELDELLVSGYLKNMTFIQLPMEITKLILKWYNTDYVYLFEEQSSIAPKWQIALQDIV